MRIRDGCTCSRGFTGSCSSFARFRGFLQPQKLGTMSPVWPIAALYLAPISLWLHHRTRLQMARESQRKGSCRHGPIPAQDARIAFRLQLRSSVVAGVPWEMRLENMEFLVHEFRRR